MFQGMNKLPLTAIVGTDLQNISHTFLTSQDTKVIVNVPYCFIYTSIERCGSSFNEWKYFRLAVQYIHGIMCKLCGKSFFKGMFGGIA